MASLADTARAKVRAWRDDPVRFVREVFAVEPDAWQIVALRKISKGQRVAMRACKGPGKTCVLAWVVWWFLATRPHPKIACTSISGDNLADGLWTELAKWRSNAPLLLDQFEWTRSRVFARDYPETWWCSARTWPKGGSRDQQADTLAGLHDKHLLFVIDEAGGVPDSVAAAAEAGLATGGDVHLLIAGNPTHLDGPLYRSATSEAHLWDSIEITADPDDPNRTPRVTKQWAQEQIDKYGRDNPWVLVNVFGKFPPSSLNSLLGPDDCGPAMKRHLRPEQYSFAAKVLGVDVARFGDDRTVIFPRQGKAAFQPVIMRHAKTHEIAARVAVAAQKWGADAIFVDDTGGYGAGVIDALELGGLIPMPVNFSGSPIDARYFNKRSEIWFLLAEWAKAGAAMPPMGELQRELTSPLYYFQSGKMRLEEKDQIKKRLGYSPDLGDALALTFSQPVLPRSGPGAQHFDRGGASRVVTEYDPLA